MQSAMKRLTIVYLTVLLTLVSACSVSTQDNKPVIITYIERQELAPARWVFKPQTELDIISYQWRFSDDDFRIRSENRQEEVSHTFEQPGIYRIRLEYQTASASEGVVESEVIINAGSISGTILAAADNLVDIDTRDPSEPSGNNDSFDQAQPIAANSRLAGVVDADDDVDFYQLQLQAMQQITVQVADNDITDRFEVIKLELFNANDLNSPVLSAETQASTGQFSSPLLVPQDASYFIKITAINPVKFTQLDGTEFHSHGIYSLSFTQPSNSANAEFAPGEINVLLKPERHYQAQGFSSKMNLGRIKTLSIDDAQAILAAANIQYIQPLAISQEETNRWQTLQLVELLSQHEDILVAEPNWKRYPSAVGVINDPFYSSQWHYETINVSQAWQALDNLGDENVVVAVLDTGVLTAHPDLSANLVAGYDYVDDDPDANDPGDKNISGQRSSFHGTHVAGTVAAAANSVGGTGVAPNVKIMPVRVLGQGGGFASDIIAGVCFAAQFNNSDGIGCSNSNSSALTADIINLSLGGPGFSQIEQAVYDAVVAKGIIVIAAAGNESTSEPSYPAAYDKVVSVAAVSRNLKQASYSNFGDTIDVAAPGGDFSVDTGVLSSWGDDLSGSAILTYGSLQGTSMAAPHVAGVAALMKSAKPSLTHIEFLNHLNAGDLTQDLGQVGRDDIFGYGLIDAQKSVLQVQQNLGPQLLSSNNSLFFNVSQSELSFVLSTAGLASEAEAGQVSVQINDANKGDGSQWLSLDKNSGLGSYLARVDRNGLAEGSYNASILVSTSNEQLDDLQITVQLQVGNPELSANAGIQYVVVLNEDAEAGEDGVFQTVAGSSALLARDGAYRYDIYGLKKGNYTISTGSDLDLDNVICDAGESCGQYPTLDQPRVITISENQPNLEINMSVNYLNASRSGLMFNGVNSRLLPMAKFDVASDEKTESQVHKSLDQ